MQLLRNAEEIKKKKEEEEHSLNRLQPKLQKFIEELQAQSSPKMFELTGLDLGPARCRILAQNIAYNNSLLSISLNRKGICDSEGQTLAQMLFTNMTLRTLEIEGNRLGPRTAEAFGAALKANMGLKLLDLSNNSLTAEGQDQSGMMALFDSLPFNTTLQTLIVSSTGLNREGGEKLRLAIENNHGVTCVDYSMNEIDRDDSEAIQTHVISNKEKLDAERFSEWKERKAMFKEFTELKLLFLEESAQKEKSLLEVEAMMETEEEMLGKWQKYLVESELEKKRLIERLEEA
eukprot:CAMPEP_0170505090 /NCGR_PEP_ID=MMETSP0208-20121228/49795_1 /TAXON_ID=197538 /ORGANISM="Strombidium inclinatum, Strain S3" /LENGTH=289 /DNA_ID=CAMNT_0010785713 /DNA_START=176 /DNA_END=1041 /DNA_ORIENTATION=-